MRSASRPTANGPDMAGIQLHSPSFDDHQPIPARHAKDQDNLSPALEWSGVPDGAAELAVLCEDPDAPSGTFVHWVLAGLQPTAPGLAEGEHPAAAVEGRNDFGEDGYSGPRPPVGDAPHRYFFRVFAASAPLGLVAGASADDLRRALAGKELASGTLIGTYQR
jgi:Raf kinase inhibitor-like YbhB/YbcL family protein